MTVAVLVTGGAGYIGSHACKALHRAGLRPIVYDDLSRGHVEAVKWGPLERGDVMDRQRLKDVMLQHRPAAVLHFAGLAYIGESVIVPASYYSANALGTLSLLEAMRASGVDTLVFSSTCAVYGRPDRLPLREDHPANPINPYGVSKLMAERMIEDCARAYGFKAAVLRYFNAAGADPQSETGEAHEPETHLIPLVLETAAGRLPHVVINGHDYDTRDGTCVRDFVHVSDLAEAHVLALKRLLQGGDSDTFNLGNGKGYSVREVIDMAEHVTDRIIPAVVAPRRSGDPAVLIADATRAMRELDWRTERSSLALQIADAWRWHCKQAALAGVAPVSRPGSAELPLNYSDHRS
jgi:UDP-glucose-4-epimerase GalE